MRERTGSVPRSPSRGQSWCIATSTSASSGASSPVAWRRCLIIAAELAGAVNITSCRSDLERAAHQLAFASRWRGNGELRARSSAGTFETAWIATLPGDNGSGLIAYDDDRRVVGACRRGRSDPRIDECNDRIRHQPVTSYPVGRHSTRAQEKSVELRRADGTSLGQGQIAPPGSAKSMRTVRAAS